jgi:hypothetical protein
LYTLLVTGDVPGASTYFNPLVQQSIIPCTSGTRPSSPPEGMHIYETDTDRMAKYTGSAWEYVAGSRVTFGPSLTATTTNPTLGSGSVQAGWYTFLPGPSVAFTFFIQFGTSGAAAGSGQYLIPLPVTAATVSGFGSNQPAMGAGSMRDNSAGSIQSATTYVPGSNLAVCALLSDNTGGTVGNATPWTWAASDYIAGSILYPI